MKKSSFNHALVSGVQYERNRSFSVCLTCFWKFGLCCLFFIVCLKWFDFFSWNAGGYKFLCRFWVSRIGGCTFHSVFSPRKAKFGHLWNLKIFLLVLIFFAILKYAESHGHQALKLIKNNSTFSKQVDSDTALLGCRFYPQTQPLDLFVKFCLISYEVSHHHVRNQRKVRRTGHLAYFMENLHRRINSLMSRFE